MKTNLSRCLVSLRILSLLSGATAVLVCGSAQSATLFTNDTAIGVLETNYEGAEIVIRNCTVTVDGAHTFASLRLLSGSRLTHTYSSNGWLTVDGGSNYPSGLDLAVSNDVLVETGAAIEANGRGFGGGFGPGAGKSSGSPASGSGGGHGGFGGNSGTNLGLSLAGGVYDSIISPGDKGSGGGRGFVVDDVGANGGGLIRISAGGLLRVDGVVSAEGSSATNRRAGGGAGGSIWLSAQTLAGAGAILASGGGGEPSTGGGGGGGRVALYAASNFFSGTVAAVGGGGAGRGGPGSVYRRFGADPAGEALYDNQGAPGCTALLPEGVAHGLRLVGGTSATLTEYRTLTSLLVGSNAWITLSNLTLIVLSNATIETGGGITANARGYRANQGPGAGTYFTTFPASGSGGGYGGFGGDCAGSSSRSGSAYGSLTDPIDYGSGGGSLMPSPESASGGGAVRLSVLGTLVVNGEISADGGGGFGDGNGGAAGGSVRIITGTLAGAGRISARGGNGNGTGLYAGGGGAGGRISIEPQVNLFWGTITARGGAGYAWGSPGTIYTKTWNQPYGCVLVDNGGALGKNTPWMGGNPVDLTVRGGGVVSLPSPQALNNLVVGPNGWVAVTNQQITVNSNLLVAAGGGIVADRTGYSSGTGSGMGRYDNNLRAGSGGGFGGAGGAVPGSTSAPGGTCYGNPVTPMEMGSGGGGSQAYGLGGSGGGSIRLNVAGNIVLDGIISANGGQGAGNGGGGGSGGTILLSASTFSGAGILAANGGDGSPFGAGGGGGRISVLAAAKTFTGSMLARGGGGSNRGGAGTICSALKNQSSQQILIDNGGQPGAVTVGNYSTSGVDLRISGGAVWVPNYYQTFNRLVIASNSAVVMTNQYQSSTVMAASMIVEPGGAILADGTGYAGGTGPGAGGYQSLQQGFAAGGGGYGGYGAGVPNTKPLGGNSYGSYTSPREMGSGGGSYASYQGGRGGGAIGLTVTGVLEVGGRISANGVSGTNSGAGGGAGGSVVISAGTLAGSGVISANGGPGLGLGGGGGGGRIAVQCTANSFTGALSAVGGATGDGRSFGGAGTVYVKLNSRPAGSLTVDNGGRLGTNTPMTAGTSPDLVVSGGAVVQPAINQSLASLLVGSNAWLMMTTQVVTVTGNATILSGGGIIADGTGYPSFQGPGRGSSYNSPGYGTTAGGAGYGGYGSRGAGSSLAFGGAGYGSMTAPTDRGSGGGSSAQVSFGGSGGGAIRLNVSGALAVAGRISADGMMGLAPGSGGGSGGSVWITAGTLGGSGLISANGGAGNGWGGAGGGGRIALEYSNNLFTGVASAFGGYGETGYGGAGTVGWRALPRPLGHIIVDNGGRLGTNTPLPSSLSPYDLTIRGGASVLPNNSSLLLSNLVVGAGGTLTWASGVENCEVAVLNDAVVESTGAIVADGKGYVAGAGPGAGMTLDLTGSGAGYGGAGGASSLLPGGITYGTLTMPSDRGSGGGFGISVPGVSGGEGGGAIRLSVGRSLVLNGSISANGNSGFQDEAGGGSGGSIWIDAGVFSGAGLLSANGGNGEFHFGGGGGGGRVAIYSPLNFFGGLTSVEGGLGFESGSPGTIYTSALHSPFVVSAQAPTGTLSSAVSRVDFTLTSALNPYTASDADFSLMTPSGPVPRENCFVAPAGSRTLRVAIPPQTLEGDYTVTLGPLPRDLYGNTLSQVHTGRFTIVWPQVHGSITDTNSQVLAGVVLQAGPGIGTAVTDASGDYALKVPLGTNVTVIPSKDGWVFLPNSISYTNLSGDLWAQDYRGFSSSLLMMNCEVQGTNLIASWFGVGGLTYQMFSSTNLVDWIPWDGQIMGSNAPISHLLPISADPAGFYQLRLVGQE